jgi:hypothetical protein
MDPKDLIAALAVLADPNASDEDKAAALDKLSGYFNSLLDSQEATSTEGASETSAETESTSEAGEDEEKSKTEAASALASALAQVKTLTERLSKLEKASAVGNAPRAKAPTVLPREAPAAHKDHVVSMIEAAERNTIRNLSK